MSKKITILLLGSENMMDFANEVKEALKKLKIKAVVVNTDDTTLFQTHLDSTDARVIILSGIYQESLKDFIEMAIKDNNEALVHVSDTRLPEELLFGDKTVKQLRGLSSQALAKVATSKVKESTVIVRPDFLIHFRQPPKTEKEALSRSTDLSQANFNRLIQNN